MKKTASRRKAAMKPKHLSVQVLTPRITRLRVAGEFKEALITTAPVTAALVAAIFSELGDLAREELWVCSCDARGRLIAVTQVAVGGMAGFDLDLASVFRAVLLSGAVSFYAAHNHPSGDPAPSDEDLASSHRIREGGKLVGLWMEDFVIVARGGRYYSLAEGERPEPT